VGAPSQQELEDFVKRVDERNLTVLNVSAVGSSGHDLSNDEKGRQRLFVVKLNDWFV
jgi:hypothetical protein